jgi:hypothetical protein
MSVESRSRLRTAMFAALVGAASGLLVWFYYTQYAPAVWSDFDQVWVGSRALLAGRDPYVEVPKTFAWPLYYPLPAMLVGLPFAPWPLLTSRVLFAILTGGIGAWSILRHRPHAWPLLCSAPFVYAIVRGQWAPLLVAGALIPWLGGLIAAKPTIGLATFAYRPTFRALAGAVFLGLVALAVQPSWPVTWLAMGRRAPHLIVPLMEPGSVILLATLGRWRRPDARVLGVLACVPQTPSLYELFPLALVPATLRQSLIVAICWNVFYLMTLATHDSVPLTMAGLAHHRNTIYWPLNLGLGYVPVLLCVLWPLPLIDRPDDFGAWPAWRKRAYWIGWGTALGLVGTVTIALAYLVVTRP